MPTSPIRKRVLVIEDDAKMGRFLSDAISQEGFDVRHAITGEEGFFLVFGFHPDLIVLDLNLPGRGGLEILRQIREQALDIRILILTSMNEVPERVQGLQSGADDYMGKPFAIAELIARIQTLLRRGQPTAPVNSFRVANLVLDMEMRRARRASIDLPLTQKEFDLLLYLVENQGRTVSRDMLARDVWHETSRFSPIDNVIDVQMARLRRKVDDPFEYKLLHTVRGVGYTLREPRP